MRMGMNVDLRDVAETQGHEGITTKVREAAELGFAAAWWPQPTPGDDVAPWDALTSIAVVGSHVPRIGLGTAVVISHLQHPLTLAARALSVQAIVGNRLILGIGPGHKANVETVYGINYEQPTRHLREYLDVLMPALLGEHVDHHGTSITATGTVRIPGAQPPSVILSAHGPAMLKMGGAFADGAIAAWTGPRAFAHHIVPHLSAAVTSSRRSKLRVIAMLPVCVTSNLVDARDAIADRYGPAAARPSYRQMVEREGANHLVDIVPIGDEQAVAAHLGRFARAGVSDFIGLPSGTPEERRRSLSLLAELNSDESEP
jgi:F420-dependent oxidoreductase-like protein